jgi:hypothetical protein
VFSNKRIFFFSGDTSNGRSFHHRIPCVSIQVNAIIDSSFIISLKDSYMQNVFTHKHLIRNFGNHINSVFPEGNNFVYIGTITNILVFLKSGSEETFLSVYIKFSIRYNHFRSLNIFKISYFGKSFPAFTILFLNLLVVVYGIVYKVIKMILTSSISVSKPLISSSAFLISNREIFLIFISVSLIISSVVISLLKSFL